MYIKVKPPWEKKIDPHTSGEEQRRQLDQIKEDKAKWSKSGKWRNWEEGRKKALRERRDYFRNHPEKEDDFSGV